MKNAHIVEITPSFSEFKEILKPSQNNNVGVVKFYNDKLNKITHYLKRHCSDFIKTDNAVVFTSKSDAEGFVEFYGSLGEATPSSSVFRSMDDFNSDKSKIEYIVDIDKVSNMSRTVGYDYMVFYEHIWSAAQDFNIQGCWSIDGKSTILFFENKSDGMLMESAIRENAKSWIALSTNAITLNTTSFVNSNYVTTGTVKASSLYNQLTSPNSTYYSVDNQKILDRIEKLSNDFDKKLLFGK